MHRFYIPNASRLPEAVARTVQISNESRRTTDADEPLMFGRLFLVIAIFFAVIAAFHQLVG